MAYARAKRVLARDSIVILDGMNYIKGWRYQLWCEAKAANTTCCVVWFPCIRSAGKEQWLIGAGSCWYTCRPVCCQQRRSIEAPGCSTKGHI